MILMNHAIECPRCGQHLDGNVAAAQARGESTGTCTECGLLLEWSKLYEQREFAPWFVEKQSAHRWLLRRVVGTLLRCLRPFYFWSAIDLAMPISRRGMIAFLIGVAVLLHGVAVVQRCGIFDWKSTVWAFQTGSGNPMNYFDACADIALVIISPAESQRGSYMVEQIRRQGGGQVMIVGKTIYGFLNPRYSTMNQFLFGEEKFWLQNSLYRQNQLRTVMIASVAIIFAPLVLLILPASLQRSRIRPRHFLRLVVYSTVLTVAVYAISFPLNRLGAYEAKSMHIRTIYEERNVSLILLIATYLLISVWMTAAAGRYLKLTHPVGVGIACSTIAVLVAMLVVVL